VSDSSLSHNSAAQAAPEREPSHSEAKRAKLESTSSVISAEQTEKCSKKTQFIDDSGSDQDLFDAADELERSFHADQMSQDAPASMGNRKIKKLFSSTKVRI
jgi:hypothetical protein